MNNKIRIAVRLISKRPSFQQSGFISSYSIMNGKYVFKLSVSNILTLFLIGVELDLLYLFIYFFFVFTSELYKCSIFIGYI